MSLYDSETKVASRSGGLMICLMVDVNWSHRVQQQQGTGKVHIMAVVKLMEHNADASQLCTPTTRVFP